MTEAELQHAVIQLAHVHGWMVAHFRPMKDYKGQWRTPVAADGKGFPDLVLVSQTTIMFIELKSDKGRLTVEQKDWHDQLYNATIAVGTPFSNVWRPRDWNDGTIERMLRDLK